MASPELWTPLCDMLNIEVPFVQAGMGYVARGELAAAVSEAGGLGVIGAASLSPDGLRREIHKVRALTERPFGVDILFATVGRPAGDEVTANFTRDVQKQIAPGRRRLHKMATGGPLETRQELAIGPPLELHHVHLDGGP